MRVATVIVGVAPWVLGSRSMGRVSLGSVVLYLSYHHFAIPQEVTFLLSFGCTGALCFNSEATWVPASDSEGDPANLPSKQRDGGRFGGDPEIHP